jgi:RNA polymerase sigma-70 factor (ECF subfamily)
MTVVDDSELIRRVQAGDNTSFAAIIDRHKDKLINYLTVLVRDRSRAEELAQDVFLKLYVHIGRYQERGQFLPYVYRIATNLVRSEERMRRRRELLLRTFSSNGNGHREPASPQAELLTVELAERVGAAIAALPLRYRSPLTLREIEGWSYGDIASALNCREGTVKSRIHRGRAELRRLLEPYWNGGH